MSEYPEFSSKKDFVIVVQSIQEELGELEREIDYIKLLHKFGNCWEQIGRYLDQLRKIARKSKIEGKLQEIIDQHVPAIEFWSKTVLLLNKKLRNDQEIMESDVSEAELTNGINEYKKLCEELKSLVDFIPEPTSSEITTPEPAEITVGNKRRTVFERISALFRR